MVLSAMFAWSLPAAARISLYGLGFGLDEDVDLADRESARGLELEPSDPSTLYFRAVFQAYSGDPTSAARLLRRALEIHPNYAQAHAQLAYQLSRIGEHGPAAEHMKRARQLCPRDPRVYMWRFWEAMVHMTRGNLARAIAACEESIDAFGVFVPAWLTYISALAVSGEHERAKQAAAKLRKFDSALDENRLRRILSQGVTSSTRFLDGVIQLYRSVGLV